MRAVTIAVRYFARLRETMGVGAETVDVSGDAASLGALLGQLRARHGERVDALQSPRIRVAVDGEIVAFDAQLLLPSRCEVAFLPPVTGG